MVIGGIGVQTKRNLLRGVASLAKAVFPKCLASVNKVGRGSRLIWKNILAGLEDL
jgi:hypothetical protein